MQYMTKIEAIDTKTNKKVFVQYETNCVIEHNGIKFESGGAFVSAKYIIAYIIKKIDGKVTANDKDWHEIFHYEIQTWHGDVISDKVNVYKTTDTKYGKIQYLRFKYNDTVYSGKTYAIGNLLKAYATKLKSIY